MTKKIVVAVSGGFDPLHIGHVRMFEEAKKLGDELVVILNNDEWLTAKKGAPFMPALERKEILEALRCVDRVVLTDHASNGNYKDPEYRSISKALRELRPHIFANGGDRDEQNAADPNSSLYWDIKTCEELGITMVYNVGRGGKVQSSSWLTERARNTPALTQ